MSTYYVNEAAFELPWEAPLDDRSVNVVEQPFDDRGQVTFCLQRGRYAQAETIEHIWKKHTENASRSLRAHEVLMERTEQIDGRTLLENAARWRSDTAMIYTRQALVEGLDGWLLFTANGPIVLREEADGALDRVLATLRLRAPSS